MGGDFIALGINQLALLRRCLVKGHVGINDVAIYYNFKISRKNRDGLQAVLEKLDIQGFLVQVDEYNWKLTEQGKHVIKNQLNLKKEAS